MIALRFFASGSYQHDIASHVNHVVTQSAVSTAITEVTNAFNQQNILNRFIRLPRNIDELRLVRTKYVLPYNKLLKKILLLLPLYRFYEAYQFPGVMGCIDCTHVAIYPPQTNDPQYPEHIYINRKGYHSINVQLVM